MIRDIALLSCGIALGMCIVLGVMTTFMSEYTDSGGVTLWPSCNVGYSEGRNETGHILPPGGR